jgi:hypothetical protein
MVAVLLIAGIGLLLVGLLTVGFGIQLELSLGNTLIFTGAIVACTGALMLGLWMVVRELKNIARRLGAGTPAELPADWLQPAADRPGSAVPEESGFLLPRDHAAPERAAHAGQATPSPLPWHDEAPRDRARHNAPTAAEPSDAAPAAKQRRNLMFSPSSRKERERAQGRAAESPAAPPAGESGEPPPASFDDAWPKSERARAPDAPARRSGRAPSTFIEPNPAASGPDRHPPVAPNEEPPPVTVLKSGVVDGMAYTLYSDGSIEAQMPEGMMRFASIEELRAHLDQRS